ncbi:VCBS repeat-containing protein [Arenibacter sp. ARW7G5Y1]|uniref:VCBS repeat-containing protein n=1 Tax=Arenibacter sp. ARW7G5Y1 TaxID=2135619 RepID=UPI000D75F317|nr:VCBS repeat-containing protein [Arenibacter sp. ARW7G5Y1]PXX30575.1 VCBS repeat protein [Arenibacter sp. ARW7G5Y1]
MKINTIVFLALFGVYGLSSQTGPKTRFTLLDSITTNVSFINWIEDNSETNIFEEENFYNGGGVAIGDINNDGLLDIYLGGNQVPDKLYLNLGNLQFKDITPNAGISNNGTWSSGVTMVDINGDGLLDIYVCKDTDPNADFRKNKLYLNKGNLTFKEVANDLGLDSDRRSVQATFFDYDRDGDLDVYLLNRPPNYGYFSDRTQNVMIPENGSQFFQNNNGQFTEITEEVGLSSIAFTLNAITSDFNNDGWIDIYVCNDFATPDLLFINNQDGTFKNVIDKAVKHLSYFSMGSDAADINNDGFSDFISVDMVSEDNRRLKANMSGMNPDKFWDNVANGGHYQYMFNALQLNRGIDSNGDLHFSEIAQISGVATTDWSWAPLFADFDNDGFKDLFVTNGLRIDFRNTDATKQLTKYAETVFESYMKQANSKPKSVWDVLDFDTVFEMYPSEKLSNYIFRNMNGIQFENKVEQWGLEEKTFSNGAAYGDLDNDGDIDLVINNINQPVFIYRNNTESFDNSNYLKVELINKDKTNSLFGAKIKIDYIEEEKNKSQFFEFTSSRGFLSSSSHIAHFGLNKVNKIDKLTIFWPDGLQTVKNKIRANQSIEIDYKEAKAKNTNKENATPFFEEITAFIGVNHKHQETNYDDFKNEGLLPHKMSTVGASVSVGDLNGDGLEDFFVGGASGQFAVFYFQNTDGSFYKKELGEDKNQEDLGSTFFDADNDGDLDLYVTSGSNEIDVKLAYYYYDRLYLNNGQGTLTRANNSLPLIAESSSVVKPFDYDQDGDLDLFIGGRQIPGKYPSPASSYLLKNEGTNLKGEPIFVDATNDNAPELINVGMVTDMQWLDFDNDKQVDIVLTGEWMSPTFLRNDNGQFTNVTASTGLAIDVGWWFSMNSADFDNDGDVDIVFGNLGLNYKYKASKSEPFEIFYNDFDQDGKFDIVLSYYNFGERYPLRGRSCSSTQMPVLREKFPDYASFSTANLDEVYTPAKLTESIHYSATEFASIYAENLGNGTFRVHYLPIEAQVSNIEDILIDDFNNDQFLDIVIAGGLYDSEVETSRNDAGVGLLLVGDGKGNFTTISPSKSKLYLDSNVKDMEFINIGKSRNIISTSSNDYVKICKIQE